MLARRSLTGTNALKRQHVIGLDILRFLAASLVVAYHFGFWSWTRGQVLAGSLPGQAPTWAAHFHFGWVGVEIFFVISGFVIAYTASDTTPASFLRSRFLRLAPASWIAATLVLALRSSIGPSTLSGLLPVYAETLVFWPLNSIDSVWWTLGIEINFYLLTCLLLRQGRGASLEAVMVTIGLLSGLFWIAALGLQTVLESSGGALGVLRDLVLHAEGNRELQLLLVQHGCLFAFGVVLWKASRFGVTRRRAFAMAALAGACLLEIAGQNGIIARASQMSLSAIPAIVAWCAAAGFLAISIVFNDSLTRWIGRCGAAVRFAGVVTYPLYLVHYQTGLAVTKLLSPELGLAAVGIGILSAFSCAALVAAFAEPWLRGVLSGLLPRAASQPQTKYDSAPVRPWRDATFQRR
jgi:peptidoglycan/LPS O-acetylase OafA/YrhL